MTRKMRIHESQKVLVELGLPVTCGLTEEQIEFLDEFTCTIDEYDYYDCDHSQGEWEFDPNTGLVNIHGSFNCSNEGLTDFMGIRFGRVTGHFYCSYNELTSLEGGPNEVGLNFNCSYNQLTNLKGSPKITTIGWEGDFDCSHNKLTSLEGAPEEVRDFNCSRNKLTSLEGAPKEASFFDCSHNKLTSLKGAPKEIGGVEFHCDKNPLRSLKGMSHMPNYASRKNDAKIRVPRNLKDKLPDILTKIEIRIANDKIAKLKKEVSELKAKLKG